jgi:hypothetical protein
MLGLRSKSRGSFGPMVEVTCHCGAVRLGVPQAPAEVTECNCSICRRLGARWAYYERATVELNRAGSTRPYVWGDRMLAFHRCRTCGCVTHWLSLNGAHSRMAVNARMIEAVDTDALRIRRFDGAHTWAYLDEA